MTTETVISPSQLSADLAQFSGTECYHKLTMGRLKFTDGVAYLCKTAKCYWLADILMSYQHKVMKNPRLREIQFWKLVVNLEEKTAVITCREDSGVKPAVTQRIPYCDFPLPEIELWVENEVVYLPGER